MKNIKDYNLEELKDEFIALGEKKYRAEQIFKWLYSEKVKIEPRLIYKDNYKGKDITKYINVNLGVSKEFLDSEAKRIADVITDIFEDIRNKYTI